MPTLGCLGYVPEEICKRLHALRLNLREVLVIYIENRFIYFNRTVSNILNLWVCYITLTEQSCISMKYISLQALLAMACFDNDLYNNLENNAWDLEHNVEKLQEILNRIMQRIMSIK